MNSQRQQERERVVGEHDEVHAGEKRREERQHATRLAFVPPVAKPVQACRGAAEIDDHEKGGRQRVQPEMRAEPGQPDGQVRGLRAGPGVPSRAQAAAPKAMVEAASAIGIDDDATSSRGARCATAASAVTEQRQQRTTTIRPSPWSVVSSISYAESRRGTYRRRRSARLQPNAASAVFADGAFADELDTRSLERGDELHQRIHIASDHAFARFHSLDRGKRQARRLRPARAGPSRRARGRL